MADAFIRIGGGRAKEQPAKVISFGWATVPGRADMFMTVGFAIGPVDERKSVSVAISPKALNMVIDGTEFLPARFAGRTLFTFARDLRPGDRVRWRESRHVSGKDNWQTFEYVGEVKLVEPGDSHTYVHWNSSELKSCMWSSYMQVELVVDPA